MSSELQNYEPKALDTQNAASGGEMGAGSDTGAFFIGGLCQLK
ncbi:hypothetical protein QDW60_09905 [Escherichia coli]|nr:hypothetical protein [Escherichia coli]EII45575.1 hypothetical protein EC23916_1996 [Escherichia coli 2.3916]MDM4024244.1 hypothetical protein [Escherichia coli]MDM4027858.1 hypothetical protein [Escherichia coli]MDM4032556.1 hypothetical protein [Escherichia coli]MDM4063089.1 hypothetical protein [Escherichia coli]